MKIFCLFSAVIILQTATIVAQSSLSHGQNVFSRRKRLATGNNDTCSTQQLKSLVDGAILKSPQKGNNSSVVRGGKAEFVCKDGYRQVGQLKSFVCQGRGNWTESPSNRSGYCAKSVSCGPNVIDVTGRATGTLTSATIDRDPPNATVDCTWKLVTKDPGFYIKLRFVKFSLSSSCTNNFISLENVNFTDLGRKKKCCGDNRDKGVCRFGGETSPPLSRSVSQSMTVKFYSKNSEKSHFKAMWYNVNGLFPNGLIPSQDATYSPQIVLAKQKTAQLLLDKPSVLALTVFALIVFAIGVVIACRLGKRYLGPSCSFGHFWAWVSSRWTSRAPSTPRRRQEEPQEARGLITDTDSPFTGARIEIRAADRLHNGDESDGSTSFDSTLMMA